MGEVKKCRRTLITYPHRLWYLIEASTDLSAIAALKASSWQAHTFSRICRFYSAIWSKRSHYQKK